MMCPPLITRPRAIALALGLCFIAKAEDTRLSLTGSFSTGFAQQLGEDENQTSVLFEPSLAARFSPHDKVEATALILRSTEPKQNFEVPWVTMRYWREFSRLRLFGQASALNADEWKEDGHQARASLGAEVEERLFERSRLALRVAPFWQWNRYTQTVTGDDLPSFGFAETLTWSWDPGDWSFEVKLMLLQAKAGVWRNDYGTAERVGYRFVPGASLNLVHELSSSLVDPSTGSTRSFRLFDGHASLLAVVLKLEI